MTRWRIIKGSSTALARGEGANAESSALTLYVRSMLRCPKTQGVGDNGRGTTTTGDSRRRRRVVCNRRNDDARSLATHSSARRGLTSPAQRRRWRVHDEARRCRHVDAVSKPRHVSTANGRRRAPRHFVGRADRNRQDLHGARLSCGSRRALLVGVGERISIDVCRPNESKTAQLLQGVTPRGTVEGRRYWFHRRLRRNRRCSRRRPRRGRRLRVTTADAELWSALSTRPTRWTTCSTVESIAPSQAAAASTGYPGSKRAGDCRDQSRRRYRPGLDATRPLRSNNSFRPSPAHRPTGNRRVLPRTQEPRIVGVGSAGCGPHRWLHTSSHRTIARRSAHRRVTRRASGDALSRRHRCAIDH